MTTLTVTNRTKEHKLDALRSEGLMPAVYYGKKEEATSIAVPQKDFIRVWNEAGESTVITLKHEGEDDVDVLIHDVHLDPVTEAPLHADFYAFERGVKLEMKVALEFIGAAPAVKNLGGVLVKVLHELPIAALPKDLPHNIEVDISGLETFEDQILAKDLKLPEGVELTEDPDEVIALVNEPKEEEEEETDEQPDFANIEVEEKGKKEEGESSEGGEEKSEE